MKTTNLVSDAEQYHHLVEECRAIIVEGVTAYRELLIKTHEELGRTVINHPLYQKNKKTQGEYIEKLASDIGKSGRSVYYAIEYVEKLGDPKFERAVEELGKNVSWSKIKALLPNGNRSSEVSTDDQFAELKQEITDILFAVWGHAMTVTHAIGLTIQTIKKYQK